MACGVACGESASGGMLQGGNRVEISDDGYLVIDGIKTNFGAENGKSAYEIYCEENPDYKGNEAQWMNDLTSGKLATQKEYSLISYGRNLAATVQTGTVSYSDTEVRLNNALLALHEPVVLPVSPSSEWKIAFKGTYMPGGTGGGDLPRRLVWHLEYQGLYRRGGCPVGSRVVLVGLCLYRWILFR